MSSPAALVRPLREAIREQGWRVELRLDHRWIFLRREGFGFRNFGDVNARNQSLGKWWWRCPPERVIEDAALLLPGLSEGPLFLAKLTNVANWPDIEAQMVVYAMDADPEVREHLVGLGKSPAWRFNHETFSG